MSVEQIVGGVVIALIIWLGRTMLGFAKEMTEWRVVLFGEDGNNGLRGTSKDHEMRIRKLEGVA